MTRFEAYLLSLLICVFFTHYHKLCFEGSLRLWLALKGINTGIDIILAYRGKIGFLHLTILCYLIHFCKTHYISFVLEGSFLARPKKHLFDVSVMIVALLLFQFVLKYRNVKKLYASDLYRSFFFLGQVLCEAGIVWILSWVDKEKRPRFSYLEYLFYMISFGILPALFRLIDTALFLRPTVYAKFKGLKISFLNHFFLTLALLMVVEIHKIVPESLGTMLKDSFYINENISEFGVLLKKIIYTFFILWAVSRANSPYIRSLLAEEGETETKSVQQLPKEEITPETSVTSKKKKQE